MENKNITLIITLYKPREFEINYWSKFYDDFRHELQIHFIWDGEPSFSIPNSNNEDVFINKKNQGKFRTIYNHIKNGHVKTPYFKVVDPDDFISMKSLKEFKFPEEDDFILITNTIRTNSWMPYKQNEIETLVSEFNSSKQNRFDTFGNSYTILPTKCIKSDNKFSDIRIDTDDDQLLGYIALNNGAKKKNVDNSFYLYISGRGETSVDLFPTQLKHSLITWLEIQRIQKLTNISLGFDFINILEYYRYKRGLYLKNCNPGFKSRKVIKKRLKVLESLQIF